VENPDDLLQFQLSFHTANLQQGAGYVQVNTKCWLCPAESRHPVE
jgi:hypothetical protein